MEATIQALPWPASSKKSGMEPGLLRFLLRQHSRRAGGCRLHQTSAAKPGLVYYRALLKQKAAICFPGNVQKITPWERGSSEIRPKNSTNVAAAFGPRLSEQLEGTRLVPRTSHHCNMCFNIQTKPYTFQKLP